jgi:hypothetical protein
MRRMRQASAPGGTSTASITAALARSRGGTKSFASKIMQKCLWHRLGRIVMPRSRPPSRESVQAFGLSALRRAADQRFLLARLAHAKSASSTS